MKNNIIKEIWEIRALVNLAYSGNKDNLWEAMRRFDILSKSDVHLTSKATQTMGQNYSTKMQVLDDRIANFNRISFNFGMLAADINSEKPMPTTFTKFGKKANSVLEVIWLSRVMFDSCVQATKRGDIDENQILLTFQAVEEKLIECYKLYKTYGEDAQTLQEKQSLYDIIDKIKETRIELYGNKQPKVDFDIFSKDY